MIFDKMLIGKRVRLHVVKGIGFDYDICGVVHDIDDEKEIIKFVPNEGNKEKEYNSKIEVASISFKYIRDLEILNVVVQQITKYERQR